MSPELISKRPRRTGPRAGVPLQPVCTERDTRKNESHLHLFHYLHPDQTLYRRIEEGPGQPFQQGLGPSAPPPRRTDERPLSAPPSRLAAQGCVRSTPPLAKRTATIYTPPRAHA